MNELFKLRKMVSPRLSYSPASVRYEFNGKSFIIPQSGEPYLAGQDLVVSCFDAIKVAVSSMFGPEEDEQHPVIGRTATLRIKMFDTYNHYVPGRREWGYGTFGVDLIIEGAQLYTTLQLMAAALYRRCRYLQSLILYSKDPHFKFYGTLDRASLTFMEERGTQLELALIKKLEEDCKDLRSMIVVSNQQNPAILIAPLDYATPFDCCYRTVLAKIMDDIVVEEPFAINLKPKELLRLKNGFIDAFVCFPKLALPPEDPQEGEDPDQIGRYQEIITIIEDLLSLDLTNMYLEGNEHLPDELAKIYDRAKSGGYFVPLQTRFDEHNARDYMLKYWSFKRKSMVPADMTDMKKFGLLS